MPILHKKRIGLGFTMLIIVFLFILLSQSLSLISDWLWFSSEGFFTVFSTIIKTKVWLGIASGLIFFSLLSLNFYIAYRLSRDSSYVSRINFFSKFDLSKLGLRILLGLSLIISTFVGLVVSASWLSVLKYFQGVSFNITDPIFSRDISFYFFSLPFIKIILGFLFWLVILSLIGAALQYISRGLLNISQKSFTVTKKAKAHLSFLIFLIFSLIAARIYYVSMTDLLYKSAELFTGGSYTDITARLPLLWVLFGLSLFCGLVVLLNIFFRWRRFTTTVIVLFLAVGILGGMIYPPLVQRLVVLPNEIAKEEPYIKRNIEATQKAFALDRVVERDLSGDSQLTYDDIKNNEMVIKNIRLWEREPLLDTLGQVQEIRTYYDFVSVDNDRYTIDGEYRQTMISPRELNSNSVPSDTFINQRLAYTHGYGAALTPVNEVTEEGLPQLFVKDIPPQSSVDSLKIKRPEVYFGELTNSYVFANTEAQEFDYPSGEENVYADYQGAGGVRVDSFWKKALFAANFRSLKILLSDDINQESRVLYHRNIKERVKKVAPFLMLDSDPYIVIDDEGRLKWIYDTYTHSDNYPYAQMMNVRQEGSSDFPTYNSFNYIRNAVKVVIDAYDGSMKFYIADAKDPLIKTYEKIFPRLFKSMDQMPEGLKAHLRYPEDIFKFQTELYSVYHMEEPQIFYNKEDKWEIPRLGQSSPDDPMMRHIITKLPEEEKEEFILMLPFTPKNKDNMSSWMVARSDGDHYGELVVYRFPKQKLVFGPSQIVNRINQDTEISQQISLWDQRGSEVIQGNLLVIPIEESILYVRPLYIRAAGGQIPELKQVIVAYEKKIVMNQNLSTALKEIFTGEAESEPAVSESTAETEETTTSNEELINQANQYYRAALEAQKQGDWTAYGQQIEKLGQVLSELE
ncbi:MAG: UPF0182 family protein [Patescibacteria group bacterium]|nr:UPF0182 family protein [Patescibacteria group bacterium]